MGDDQKKESADYTDVENGPITEANRQCRDIFCCLIYLLAIVAMIYFTIVAYASGNPTNIFRPISTAGVACGDTSSPAASYPYVYYSNPFDMLNHRYCVASCPSLDSNGNVPTSIQVYPSGTTVTFTVTVSSSGNANGSFTSSNVDVGYDSSLVLNRICMPSTTVFSNAFSSYTSAFSGLQLGDLANFILDIRNNWQWLLAAFGFAILISFIWMFCLRCLAGVIVWASIFGIIIFFACIGVIFLYNAGKISAIGQYNGYLNIPTISAGGQSNYEVYAYISFAVSGIFFIAMLCCCSRIRLAVAVCKAAGQFIVDVCLIMLVPIFQACVLLGFWAACLVVMVFLVSAANFKVTNTSDYFTSVDYGDSSLVKLYCFIFTTLWSHGMIQAIGIFVIASACCMWYYSHGPGSQLDTPIFRSYKMAFRYHFGSLAFGSLILAIVQALQIMVQLFKKQAEANGAANTKCFQYLISCLRCCLACVQRIVQFINKTAYIQIAIRGKNFCTAAKDGFELVWSNGIRFAIVAGIGEIMMFLGKLAIAALTCGLFYLLILYNSSARSSILQPIYLLIVVFIMSYAVGMLFMSVYSLAMDTLLACFIIDETNQKAKGGKAPQFAPPELAALIDTD